MQYDVKVYVCDQCKEESETQSGMFGGKRAGYGWFNLTQKLGYPSNQRHVDVDLCSEKCLKDYIKEHYEVK